MIEWPILDRIRIGGLSISPHGIGIAFGYLAGSWWMIRQGPKRGLKEEHIGTILLWALVGAIFGARFFFVVGHLEDFQSFTEMLQVWKGGISLVGGIFGAIIFAYPFMRKFRYRFLQVMDSAAIGLAFGIIFGRIGDLIIGDHLGKPTDFFLGWRYGGGNLPGPWSEQALGSGVWTALLPGGQVQTITEQGATLVSPGGDLIAAGAGIHQTALYDFFIAIGLFLFLYWLARKPRREGVLIATFALVYGAGRVVTDYLRVDKTWALGLTGSQWASVVVMALALVFLIRSRIRSRRPPVPVDREPEEMIVPEPESPTSGPERPSTAFVPPREPGT